jgi:GABA permease
MDVRQVLVIANRTLCDPALLQALRERSRAGPAQFHLLVPASHPSGFWTEAQAEREAQERLTSIIGALDQEGIPATGEIGDAGPVTAASDLLRRQAFDEIVVSTLPTGLSRWLSHNVVRRLGTFGLPVTHVVAEEVHASV